MLMWLNDIGLRLRLLKGTTEIDLTCTLHWHLCAYAQTGAMQCKWPFDSQALFALGVKNKMSLFYLTG